MKRKLLILVEIIIISLCLTGYIRGKALNKRKTTTALEDIKKYNDFYNEQYLKLPVDSNDIVFLGNSLVRNFPSEEYYRRYNVVNRGIPANRSSEILKRIATIANGKPKKIFIEDGINDIGFESPAGTFETNFTNYTNKISCLSPCTKVYVFSIFSVEDKKQNEKVILLNPWLETYCKRHNITFINLYPLFMATAGNATMTSDGVHLTAQGNFIWAKAIKKYVEE